MDVSRLSLNKLAGQVTQPNLPNFMAPSEGPQLHLATVTVVDLGRNECAVQLNDYLNRVIPRVPVLGGVMPAVGALVQLIQTGKSLAVLGEQSRPAGSVTF